MTDRVYGTDTLEGVIAFRVVRRGSEYAVVDVESDIEVSHGLLIDQLEYIIQQVSRIKTADRELQKSLRNEGDSEPF